VSEHLDADTFALLRTLVHAPLGAQRDRDAWLIVADRLAEIGHPAECLIRRAAEDANDPGPFPPPPQTRLAWEVWHDTSWGVQIRLGEVSGPDRAEVQFRGPRSTLTLAVALDEHRLAEFLAALPPASAAAFRDWRAASFRAATEGAS
jgi:hypothetical protein